MLSSMLPNAEVPALPSRRVRSTSICKVNILIRPLIISLLTTSLHNPSLNGSDRQNISNLRPSDPVSGSLFVPSPLIPSLRAVNTGAIPFSPFQISCIHSLTLYRLCILPGYPFWPMLSSLSDSYGRQLSWQQHCLDKISQAAVPFRQKEPVFIETILMHGPKADLPSFAPFFPFLCHPLFGGVDPCAAL